MKVFFISSPRGLDKYSDNYDSILKSLEKLGHKNISNFPEAVDEDGLYLPNLNGFYNETVTKIKSADVCIFETSIPSLGVGHLVSLALQLNKPVIALYSGDNFPSFFNQVEDEKIQVISYNKENVSKVIADAIDYAASQQDVRFNFFISPAIGNYLDWISKVKKIPRSVYLRNLIEKNMEENDEYNS